MLRRRGQEARAARGGETDAAKVMEEARSLLRAIDVELSKSFSAARPRRRATAADLTLFGMLERCIGDGLCPGTGRRSPRSSRHEGIPAIGEARATMQSRFRPDCDCLLHELKGFADIKDLSVDDVAETRLVCLLIIVLLFTSNRTQAPKQFGKRSRHVLLEPSAGNAHRVPLLLACVVEND